MTAPLRLAVLISGTGSNLKTLLDARAEGRLNVEVVRVICNRPHAGGLAHARDAGVPLSLIHKENAGEAGQDEAVRRVLEQEKPDLILLSGYMRILGAPLVNAFQGRMINQHPSLLPKYKGLHTHRRALEARDSVHGASIHFVTPELDGGPVIAQVQVPVEHDDDESTLSARVGPREHQLLLSVMELFVERRVELKDGLVWVDDRPLQAPLQLEPDVLSV